MFLTWVSRVELRECWIRLKKKNKSIASKYSVMISNVSFLPISEYCGQHNSNQAYALFPVLLTECKFVYTSNIRFPLNPLPVVFIEFPSCCFTARIPLKYTTYQSRLFWSSSSTDGEYYLNSFPTGPRFLKK